MSAGTADEDNTLQRILKEYTEIITLIEENKINMDRHSIDGGCGGACCLACVVLHKIRTILEN